MRSCFSSASAPSRLPFETASRLSQRTIGQVAELIGTASQAAVPVLSGQPARQPVDVHPGAGVAELQPGGLLVAQLLSRHDRPGHARAARNGAGQQAGRVSFPTPIASNGRLPRRSWCARSWRGSWPSGSSSGQFDLARRTGFCPCDPFMTARNRCWGSFRGMIEPREPR